MKTDNDERNWKIYWRRCAGEHLHDIAKDFGISGQRVRQIHEECRTKRGRRRYRQERSWMDAAGFIGPFNVEALHEFSARKILRATAIDRRWAETRASKVDPLGKHFRFAISMCDIAGDLAGKLLPWCDEHGRPVVPAYSYSTYLYASDRK